MKNSGLKEELISSFNNILVKYPCVSKAILFGSRAKGNFKPNSDIDISLVGNISERDFMHILLEVEDLPYLYKFDLNVYNKVNSASLKAHIDRVGIVFYAK